MEIGQPTICLNPTRGKDLSSIEYFVEANRLLAGDELLYPVYFSEDVQCNLGALLKNLSNKDFDE